jgi:hypothetical protein
MAKAGRFWPCLLAWAACATTVAFDLDPRSALAAEGYVEGVEDLPLMPGLGSVGGAGLVFDVPEGRIVVGYALGAVSAESVIRFYAETLPQLGWTRQDDGSFVRDRDRLRFEMSGGRQGLTVRFTVSPR